MGVLQGAHRNDRLIGLVHVKEAERANPRGPKGTVELRQSGGGGAEHAVKAQRPGKAAKPQRGRAPGSVTEALGPVNPWSPARVSVEARVALKGSCEAGKKC